MEVLEKFQEQQTEILSISEKAYYDMRFTVTETREEYFVMFRLYGEILRLASAEDVQYIINSYATAYSLLTYKIKLIIDSDYLDLSKQRNYWKQKEEAWRKENNDVVLPFLEEKQAEFDFFQAKSLTEAYRVKVFGSTEKEVLQNAFLLQKYSDLMFNVEDIENATYLTRLHDSDPFYIRDGKGYRTCLVVYDVPDQVPLSWLASFNDDIDTYVTIDIVPLELKEIKKSIQTAIKEQLRNYSQNQMAIDTHNNCGCGQCYKRFQCIQTQESRHVQNF